MYMKLEQVIEIVNAKVICGSVKANNIERGFCSDLMSDVLTIDTDKLLIITGLANVQAIRTAEMADVNCILLVRNKKATADMIKVAEENNMIIMETSFSMFHVAGKLYEAGLKPVY